MVPQQHAIIIINETVLKSGMQAHHMQEVASDSTSVTLVPAISSQLIR